MMAAYACTCAVVTIMGVCSLAGPQRLQKNVGMRVFNFDDDTQAHLVRARCLNKRTTRTVIHMLAMCVHVVVRWTAANITGRFACANDRYTNPLLMLT